MHQGEKKRARQELGDQQADGITNEHRVKSGPHQHCLTKELKNNVCGASPHSLRNYACE